MPVDVLQYGGQTVEGEGGVHRQKRGQRRVAQIRDTGSSGGGGGGGVLQGYRDNDAHRGEQQANNTTPKCPTVAVAVVATMAMLAAVAGAIAVAAVVTIFRLIVERQQAEIEK